MAIDNPALCDVSLVSYLLRVDHFSVIVQVTGSLLMTFSIESTTLHTQSIRVVISSTSIPISSGTY